MWWRMNEAIRMQLSAFVDGELPDNEAELLLRRLSQDAELRQHVAEYMAIGRAIRGDTQVAGIDGLRDRIAATIDEDGRCGRNIWLATNACYRWAGAADREQSGVVFVHGAAR